jgi:hypothetical protein
MGFVDVGHELAVALKATLVEITHQYRSDNCSEFGGHAQKKYTRHLWTRTRTR